MIVLSQNPRTSNIKRETRNQKPETIFGLRHMNPHKIIIEPQRSVSFRLKEIWEYRELFYFFTWRDIKVKYKQTQLGLAWAVLQPVVLMLLFTFLFAKKFAVDSGAVRYPVFVLSGLILWNFFYAAVSHSAQSIIEQSAVIKKIYFPRLIIPASAILTAMFDFCIAFLLFLLCCLFFRQSIQVAAVGLFPAAIVFTAFSAFGLGTFLSALTVKFRDFRYALPFLLQALFFGSAVLYALPSISQGWLQNLLALNPLNGAISLFRSALGEPLDVSLLLISLASSLLLAAAGLFYFRKTETYFADIA